MELGGKNAMIVLEDADLGRAVEGAERALFSNAGQLCISIERLFVHESVADEFTRRLTERVRAMKLGTDAGLRRRHGLADLAAPSSRRSRAHVEDAVAKGAEVLAGGKRAARPRPVLLRADAARQRRATGMTLFRDETFGPVVAVSRFSAEDEVVERANDCDYGLNFSALDARHAPRRARSPRACGPAR